MQGALPSADAVLVLLYGLLATGQLPLRRHPGDASPGLLHASACRSIRRLYSAVNRRRWAFATSSVSCANALARKVREVLDTGA